MLFTNLIAAQCPLNYHLLHQLSLDGLKQVEVMLMEDEYTTDELKEMFGLAKVTPIAFRMPPSLGLGTSSFSMQKCEAWLNTLAPVFQTDERHVIFHGSGIPLGMIFSYLDERPTDFNALTDFKADYVKTIIEQLEKIKEIAEPLGITLHLENAPMGSEAYFEPGQSKLYPALRTPRHLLNIAEETGIKLLFDTAHARITSNVLTYMHRSRSLFAGATEQEILSTPSSWIDYYKQVKPHVSIIRLSYAISWGDTPVTNHIPFPESAYAELIAFAETVDPNTPIILPMGEGKGNIDQMMQTLKNLKRT